MQSINSLWQQITLSNLPLYRWQRGSYLSRLFVGSLGSWRSSSWLMQWSEAIGALLCALIFGLAPFVSTALIGVLLLAAAGYWLLLTVSDEGEMVFTPIHLLVLLYWAIATVATAMSPVKTAALTGWVKLTLYLMLFALLARVLRSPRIRSLLIGIYLHISLIVSVYGLRQWFFGAPALATWTDPTSSMAGVTRVYSYLENPNLLAAYVIPATIFSVGAIFVWSGLLPKLLAVTMTVVNSFCLLFTWSRGGWIGLSIASFVLLLMLVYWWSPKLPPAGRKWALPGVFGATVTVLLLAFLFVEPLRDRIASMFVGRSDSSNNFRINVWQSVIEMIRDRPILGIGPGNSAFNKIYPLYMRPRFSALSAYSVWLETAVETGIIGLMAFFWLLVVTLNQGLQQLQQMRSQANLQGYWLMGAIAIIVGMLGHGVVDTVWYRPQINTLWWLVMAIVASYYPDSRPQPNHSVD
jgi:putative inorganic carbon (HCO3(-)) transporter